MVISLPLLKKFFPLFASFLIFIFSLLAIFLFSYSFFLFFLFSFLAILAALIFLILILEKEIKNFWPFLISLLLFIYNFILFLIFTRNQILKIFFLFFFTFLSWFIFEIIFRFLYLPRKYPVYSLENISWILSFIISFLFFSNLFAFVTLLNFSIVNSLILVFFITLGITWLIFRQIKIPLAKTSLFVVSLVVMELFYSFTFLPTAFYINGFLLMTLFYLMVSLIKKNKEGELTARTIKKHIFLASLLLILIFILAKWR